MRACGGTLDDSIKMGEHHPFKQNHVENNGEMVEQRRTSTEKIERVAGEKEGAEGGECGCVRHSGNIQVQNLRIIELSK